MPESRFASFGRFRRSHEFWLLIVILVLCVSLGAANGQFLTMQNLFDLLTSYAFVGIGLGLLVVRLVDVALATIPTTEAGAASGTYGTVQHVVAALGVAITGTVFFSVVGTSYEADSLRTGLVAACWVAAAGYALAAIASLLLPSRAQVLAHHEAHERELTEDPVAV